MSTTLTGCTIFIRSIMVSLLPDSDPALGLWSPYACRSVPQRYSKRQRNTLVIPILLSGIGRLYRRIAAFPKYNQQDSVSNKQRLYYIQNKLLYKINQLYCLTAQPRLTTFPLSHSLLSFQRLRGLLEVS